MQIECLKCVYSIIISRTMYINVVYMFFLYMYEEYIYVYIQFVCLMSLILSTSVKQHNLVTQLMYLLGNETTYPWGSSADTHSIYLDRISVLFSDEMLCVLYVKVLWTNSHSILCSWHETWYTNFHEHFLKHNNK